MRPRASDQASAPAALERGCNAATNRCPERLDGHVRPYSKGRKNDYRDAEAIAEAVQRPTMKFVATKTADQLDLQALHRVRERFVGQRTGIINQIRAFLLERGIAVRQGLRFLQAELPGILATRTDALSPRIGLRADFGNGALARRNAGA
jgi:transposase